jgi:rhodanese-related sulfurtransferase
MKQLGGPELIAMAGAAGEAGQAAPLLLDVREPWEFALAAIRIEGLQTLSMPMNSVPERLAELSPAQPVVCICHHGARSAQVVAFLERQGFEAAYNLAGGIDAWSQQVDPAVPRY